MNKQIPMTKKPYYDGSKYTSIHVDDFREQLADCLEHAQFRGNFYGFQNSPDYADPGLYITDHGPISLPLTDHDAEAFMGVCEGSDTAIKPTSKSSPKGTWELDYGSFECRNPSWSSYLQQIVEQCMDQLGAKGPVRLKKYGLSLYREGASYMPHEDGEKQPGMFGTLVLFLPSDCRGGRVHLTHDKEMVSLDTEQYSSHSISALAWYSDVSHEMDLVNSGNRLVLTYHLLQDQRMPRQAASMLTKTHTRLGELLRIWNQEFDDIEKLIFPLEYG
ncbi:unnamed protein product [Periconia digitata]|uniref:Prolyl 4-hydroxylase alpha subunit Fe(2+) 2OG dioxygenase domain-containing protein n=1 Tax=Periconia digitata TaxID=1303443 RepID=A0A9W4XS12_9PLEO|nr:unnamed protein product [Periconia digitata]